MALSKPTFVETDGVQFAEERRMAFALPNPSLQHLALLKVATGLWDNDMLSQFPGAFSASAAGKLKQDKTKWTTIESQVTAKVTALPNLPALLKTQLTNLIKPLRFEIAYWFTYHYNEYKQCNNFPFGNVLLPQQICWSPHGTVDYVATARVMLMNDGSLDVKSRYELSCANCLEEEARELFKALDEAQTTAYINGGNLNEACLIYYFTRTFKDQSNSGSVQNIRARDDMQNIAALIRAVHSGNRARCEYFLQKWSPDKREKYLAQCLRKVLAGSSRPRRSGTAIYAVSLLNQADQRVVGANFAHVLCCLLRWPMQPLFAGAVKCFGWKFLKKFDRHVVLYTIVRKYSKGGFRDHDYPRLLWECCQLSSWDDYKHLMENFDFLLSLIASRREEAIRLVFKETRSFLMPFLLLQFPLIEKALQDESVICTAALEELKREAELSSADRQLDETERRRNRWLTQLLNKVIDSRRQLI